MVEMIVLKKGILYPDGFRETVRQFNQRLLKEYDPYMHQLLEQFPGSQIRHLEIEHPKDGDANEYTALTEVRERAHRAHFNPGEHQPHDPASTAFAEG